MSHDIHQTLNELKYRMDVINRQWTVDNYESLLSFYMRILPKVMGVERCSIFVQEPVTGKIWSKIGTGLNDSYRIEVPRDNSVVGRCISSAQIVVENDLSTGFHTEVDANTGFVTRNLLCAPIKSLAGQDINGAVEILNKLDHQSFDEQDSKRLQEVADYLAMAMDNILLNQEIMRISKGMNQQIDHLTKKKQTRFVAESPVMRTLVEEVKTLSRAPINVFIQGENGTGKELIARMIHDYSECQDTPLVTVNCAAIPENLVESEFFGYEKGAFTGATGSRKGRFEEADGGILFLDEIADLPLHSQAKILRALEEGESSRLGSNRVRHFNVRIISATNKDLRQEVADGNFREDLFYRLFAIDIMIPPLRERREDIAVLALVFLEQISRRFKKSLSSFSPEVLACFENYAWPGNVRQLHREVERLVALTPPGESISAHHLSRELRDVSTDVSPSSMVMTDRTLPEQVTSLEQALIRQALTDSRGNKCNASQVLGITRQGLHKKLKRYAMDEFLQR
jgi:transcriptional regulator with GAF, ATPase, and Fis domain